MMQAVIYAVDDEAHIRELISYNLKKDGYEVRTFPDGDALLAEINRKKPSLVLLDVMLPGKSGIELCAALRSGKETADIPIMMLTAKNEEIDKIIGLEIGADDYLTKPFSVRELSARIKALLRRSVRQPQEKNKVITIGDIVLDADSRKVTKGSEELSLTYKEFELLKLLMENKGKVLSRDYLLDTIWGYNYVGESRTIDVHIRSLRKHLGDDGERYIETSRGTGYRFRG